MKKEKPNVGWDKGSGDLRAKSHSAKFSTYRKELKKTLRPGVVLYIFNEYEGVKVKSELDARTMGHLLREIANREEN